MTCNAKVSQQQEQAAALSAQLNDANGQIVNLKQVVA
jgi:hypothetical protein